MKSVLVIGILSLLSVSPGVPQEINSAKSPDRANPKHTSAQEGSERKDADEARQLLEAKTYYQAGVAFYAAGKFSEAAAALKEAKKLNGEDAQTNYMLGMAYSKLQSYKDSAEAFKRAAKLRPDWPEAHLQSGMLLYVIGRMDESREEYRRLLELNSPLANGLYQIIQHGRRPAETIKLQPGVLPATGSAEATSVSATTGAISAGETSIPPQIQRVPDTGAASLEKTAGSLTSSESRDQGSRISSTYSIGVGDVLDIRLLNSPSNRSTLYTVLEGGVIDLPIVGGPIGVKGLRTEDVQELIIAELKRRAVEEGAQVTVGVRQYVSHSILITGLVGNPGRKVLQRDAVPLYVILAEAQPRLDASIVSVVREGAGSRSFDLNDIGSLDFFVSSGDVISVAARPPEFYYIGGRINYPGQKVFQRGLTLLQAILAAGGLSKPGDGTVELSRETADGHLITTKIALKNIKSGKIPDPKLQSGDRIDIIR